MSTCEACMSRSDGQPDTRVGVDLVAVAEVAGSLERYGERYLDKLYTCREVSDARGPEGAMVAESLAGRFAAKEAVMKVLSVGPAIPSWREIECRRAPNGQPVLHLSGTALRLADEAGIDHWSVSMAHEAGMAVAVVLASTRR